MTTIAAIADIHVSDNLRTSQWACLDWALDIICRRKPDAIVVAGDVTSFGQFDAAREFLRRLAASGIPFIVTPGNADIRNEHEASVAASPFGNLTALKVGGLHIATLDSSNDISRTEMERFDAALGSLSLEPLVVVTHVPPAMLPDARRRWLENYLARGTISLLIAGHSHRDTASICGCGAVHILRGMDPDKAIGGPPALSFFEMTGARWIRRDEVFTPGTFDCFTSKERAEFRDLLGICCLDEPLEVLDFAIDKSIRCVELRSGSLLKDTRAIPARIARWRDAGGRFLSLHLPDLAINSDPTEVVGPEHWLDNLEMAVNLGLNQLTVHVPDIPVHFMSSGSGTRRVAVDFLVDNLRPLTERGMIVAVENMHMRDGEPTDESRRFGYLPGECLDWVSELRTELGAGSVGILLDMGHARNNGPFAKRITMSDWYADVGSATVAYHIHQVKTIDGRMKNHQGFDTPWGPLISLSGFFWAWKTRQLNHAPLFVEVRDLAYRLRTLVELGDMALSQRYFRQ